MNIENTWIEDLWHGIAGVPATKVKYPLEKTDYLVAYTPFDCWGHLLPFGGPKFNWKRWKQAAEKMSTHYINGTRAFWTGTEDEWGFKNLLMPYKRVAPLKVDLLQFGPELIKIEERLAEFWKRGISTIICANYLSRWKWAVWNGRHNVNGTTTGSRSDFMGDRITKKVCKEAWLMLCDRYKNNPYVILETGNELPTKPAAMWADWQYEMIEAAVNAGIPVERLWFGYNNTSKIYPILDKFDIWCAIHTVNNYEGVRRHHRGEVQTHFFEKYSRMVFNTDGWNTEDCPKFLGRGIKGCSWFTGFQKFASGEIKPSLIYDKHRKGNGMVFMSGTHIIDEPDGTKPDCFRGRAVALRHGLSREECRKYERLYRGQYLESRKANPNLPDYEPSFPYELNKTPEFKAIKKAVESIHN